MLEFINKYVLGATVPVVLMLVGIFFLARLKFFPITRCGQVLGALMRGGRSSLSALALSLAGTLGVGNIAGVATAIYLGGCGSLFWMWVSALVAAVLKYAEVVLAMRMRVLVGGELKGGAPYYIRAVLSRRAPLLGRALSLIFALLLAVNCISMGAVIQTAAVAEAFYSVASVPPVLCGAVLAVFALALMLGGGERISRFNSSLVPFMSVCYILLSLAVIIPHRGELPLLFSRIFSDAFSLDGALGGVGGFLLSRALRFGVMRGLFSNEAGCGTSPIAHAHSDSHPCEQGFMGIAEVVIDTVVLCSLTGFVLLLGGGDALGEAPVRAVLYAYSAPFGEPFGEAIRLFMAFMILCFGFATVSCLAHYLSSCVGFISRRRGVLAAVCGAYCLAVLLGACVPSEWAWGVADLTVGIMTLINLSVLIIAREDIADETKKYFLRQKIVCFNGKKRKTP